MSHCHVGIPIVLLHVCSLDERVLFIDDNGGYVSDEKTKSLISITKQ